MRQILHRILLTATLVLLGALSAWSGTVVRGRVSNAETGEPLFPATLRIVGTSVATVTNEDGRFAVEVTSLPISIACSHIGFRTDTLRVSADNVEVNLRMIPVMLEMEEIVVSAEDPAMSIMRKVIERKEEWKQSLESLKGNAYSRLALRKDTTIVSVIESMSDAFWRKGEGWREILKAKRMTRNMKEDLSLPAAAFMENLYEDDVVVSGHTLHGVTHPDALEIYDFKLTGRRRMDDATVYDIDVIPRSKRSSAFVGSISVLDGAYALLDVRLTPNESFLFPPPFREFTIRFGQQFRQFEDAWLPVDLRTEVFVDIGMLGFSIPPIRSEQVTRLSGYEVNAATPDSLFESERELVTDLASETVRDSLMESTGVVIPLSEEEKVAFEVIDSTATLDKVFKPEGTLARLMDDGDGGAQKSVGDWRIGLRPYGWYNRVDGLYGSLKPQIRSKDGNTRLRSEIGYGATIERWSFGGDLWHVWGKRREYRVSAGYRRGSSPRQTTDLYSNFNASTALTGGEDYFDHYWREQFRLQGRHKIRSWRTDIVPGLRVERHSSLPKATDFAILDKGVQRPNPAIEEGDLRSLTFRVTHARDGGPPAVFGQRRLQLSVEHSRPGLMGSDFDFTQFRLYAAWRFKTFFARRIMPNALDIVVIGGKAYGHLPIQRFGHIDASLEGWHNPGSFRALHTNPYEGEHYFAAFWEHHFRTLLFEYLGWDWLVERNIGIIVYGAHGRTWISEERLGTLSYKPKYIDRFHHEAGISLNGLFGLLRLDFTKQLDTDGFTFGMGFARIF